MIYYKYMPYYQLMKANVHVSWKLVFVFKYFIEAIVYICIFYGSKCLQLHISWMQYLIFACFMETSHSVYIFLFYGCKYNGRHLTGILHNLHECFIEPHS